LTCFSLRGYRGRKNGVHDAATSELIVQKQNHRCDGSEPKVTIEKKRKAVGRALHHKPNQSSPARKNTTTQRVPTKEMKPRWQSIHQVELRQRRQSIRLSKSNQQCDSKASAIGQRQSIHGKGAITHLAAKYLPKWRYRSDVDDKVSAIGAVTSKHPSESASGQASAAKNQTTTTTPGLDTPMRRVS
jgi:hypothetical protein